MALVHPDTAKLPPEDQKKGIYEYTPFEVRAYLRGESLSESDMQIVATFYEGIGQPIPEPAGRPDSRPVTQPVAMAAPYVGKKVIRKPAPVFNSPLPCLRQIAELSVGSLPDNDAYALLVKLANRFGMEIE